MQFTSVMAAAGLVGGCSLYLDEPPAEPPPVRSVEQVMEIPVDLARRLDVLFVIDTGPTMAEEQAALAASFAAIAGRFDAEAVDLHVGVTSADLGIGGFEGLGCAGSGDDGALSTSGCRVGPEPFLIDAADDDGNLHRNFDGSRSEALACMVALGTDGCAFPQPLAAARRALDRDAAGFRRDGAAFLLILVTDQDDCSAANPALFDPSQDAADAPLGVFAPYRCFEDGVVCAPDAPRALPDDGTPVLQGACVPRPEPSYLVALGPLEAALREAAGAPPRFHVALLASDPLPLAARRADVDGDGTLEAELVPSCVGEPGLAGRSPVRLAAFADRIPNSGSRDSICRASAGGELVDRLLVDHPWNLRGVSCLTGELADLNAAGAGVQPDCRVSEVQFRDTDREIDRPMPPCEPGGWQPCWRALPSPDCAGEDFPTGLAFVIERAPDTVARPQTTIVVRCLVE